MNEASRQSHPPPSPPPASPASPVATAGAAIVVRGLHARVAGAGSFFARKPPSFVRNVSFTWQDGVLAVLGAPQDGAKALLGVLAGNVRPQLGSVSVLGGAPDTKRAEIAFVPMDVSLPDSLRVSEICDLAASVRGEPTRPAAERLAPLGLESLLARRGASLSPGEARAVLLALAITSNAKVLLVEEPLAGLDAAAPARVIEALRSRTRGGGGDPTAPRAVIVTTASVRDATRLGDQLGLLTQGAYTHLPPSLAHVGPAGARLRVVLGGAGSNVAAPFVSALSGDPAIGSIETTTFGADDGETRALVSVVLGGPNLLGLATAVASAASKSNAPIEAVESAVMPLDAIRAALVVPRQGPASPTPPAPPPSPPSPSTPPTSRASDAPPAEAAAQPPPSSLPPSGGAA